MNRIKELRLKNNYKQIELAKVLNTSQANVSGWESGKWQPSYADVEKICKLFNCSSDYLLGFDTAITGDFNNSSDYANTIILIGRNGVRTVYKVDEKRINAIKDLMPSEDKD